MKTYLKLSVKTEYTQKKLDCKTEAIRQYKDAKNWY